MEYDKAQICRNGHVITPDLGRYRGVGTESFCSRCGIGTLLNVTAVKPYAGAIGLLDSSHLTGVQLFVISAASHFLGRVRH